MKKLLNLLVVLAILAAGCGSWKISQEYPESLQVLVENPSELERIDGAFTLCVSKIKENNPDAFLVLADGQEVPGQDGFDSYHEMADWGADVFNVGDSFGVGSFGTWYQNKANRVAETDSITCAIQSNGPVFSQTRTVYYGWNTGNSKVDLTSDLSISAGSRLTHCKLSIKGEVDNICTGLAKHENTRFIKEQPKTPDEWGYIALWGNQSLAGEDDQLGIAVIYRGSQFDRITEDDLNYVVILKPEGKVVNYYFLAAWDQEPEGIKSKDAFVKCLEEIVLTLNAALVIEF